MKVGFTASGFNLTKFPLEHNEISKGKANASRIKTRLEPVGGLK